MKRFFLALALVSFSLTSFAAGKIAVVNFEQAILNTDFAQQEIAAVEGDKSFKERVAEIKKIQEEGVKLAQKYQKEAPTMSASQKQMLESQIKEKQEDLEHVARKIQEVKNMLMQNLMEEMDEVASIAAKELIEKEGIGLLLNGNPQIILHADTSYDVTAKLTDRINKLYSKKKK